MATADLEFNLKINGTPEEKTSILNIMFEYCEGKNGVYFSSCHVKTGDREFHTITSDKEEILSACSSGDTVTVSTMGPYGRYGELDDIDIFREMAEAAPNASFTASISGFAGYADQSLNAALADGLLKVSTYYLSDDCRADGERDYFESILPYDKFIELFKLDSEEFDEEMYEDFLIDAIGDYDGVGEFFEETDFDEFVEMLDAECPLTEEEYDEIIEEFTGLADESVSDYLEREGYTQQESYTYDPVEKKYSDGRGSKMKSGVAYSINDDIRTYLDSIGHPSDDEAINALSVEDVYTILAGTYGKEASAAAENCDDDDNCDDEDPDPACEDEAEDDDNDDEDDDEAEDVTEAESEAVEEINVESEDAAEAEVVNEAESETEKADAEDEVEAEAETETEAETTTETKEETDSPKKKKSFPLWLIIVFVALVLIGVAAYASGYGEKLWNYIADLLGTAARLL